MFKNLLILLSFSMMVQPAFSMDGPEEGKRKVTQSLPRFNNDGMEKWQYGRYKVRVQHLSFNFSWENISSMIQAPISLPVNIDGQEGDCEVVCKLSSDYKQAHDLMPMNIIFNFKERYESTFIYNDVMTLYDQECWGEEKGIKALDKVPAEFACQVRTPYPDDLFPSSFSAKPVFDTERKSLKRVDFDPKKIQKADGSKPISEYRLLAPRRSNNELPLQRTGYHILPLQPTNNELGLPQLIALKIVQTNN